MRDQRAHTGRPAGRLVKPETTPLARRAKRGTSTNDSYTSEANPKASAQWQRRSRLHIRAGQLSQRDRAILTSLGRIRLLTATQVERLHFREGSARTQARRSRHCLARLHSLDLLHRFHRRIGGLHAGSSGYIYGLTGWGQRLAGADGPAGGERRRRPWEPSPAFQDHILAVSELYVQLVEAHRAEKLELLRFEAEPDCWRNYDGPSGERLTLKPDAFVIMAHGNYEHLSFIELDRDTQGTAVIRSKGRIYQSYWQSGQEHRQHGVFPSVVFLVPDDKRQQQVKRALSSLDDPGGLFRVATFSEGVATLGGGPA